MRIHIRSSGIEVTSVLRAHVEHRLGLALGRFAERIRRVTVRFSNTEEPQSGSAARCHIDVGLRPSGSVWAEDTSDNLTAGVDHATDRIARAVALALERVRFGPRKWGI